MLKTLPFVLSVIKIIWVEILVSFLRSLLTIIDIFLAITTWWPYRSSNFSVICYVKMQEDSAWMLARVTRHPSSHPLKWKKRSLILFFVKKVKSFFKSLRMSTNNAEGMAWLLPWKHCTKLLRSSPGKPLLRIAETLVRLSFGLLQSQGVNGHEIHSSLSNQ